MSKGAPAPAPALATSTGGEDRGEHKVVAVTIITCCSMRILETRFCMWPHHYHLCCLPCQDLPHCGGHPWPPVCPHHIRALLTGKVRQLVLDEADQLMGESFYKDVAWLHQQLPSRRQVGLQLHWLLCQRCHCCCCRTLRQMDKGVWGSCTNWLPIGAEDGPKFVVVVCCCRLWWLVDCCCW